jgi:hypothetical protein
LICYRVDDSRSIKRIFLQTQLAVQVAHSRRECYIYYIPIDVTFSTMCILEVPMTLPLPLKCHFQEVPGSHFRVHFCTGLDNSRQVIKASKARRLFQFSHQNDEMK